MLMKFIGNIIFGKMRFYLKQHEIELVLEGLEMLRFDYGIEEDSPIVAEADALEEKLFKQIVKQKKQ